MAATHRLLPDGRLHLHHGPIDIVALAEGRPAEVAAAHAQATARFATILEELVAELPTLRRPVAPGPCPLKGTVARRMWAAALPHATREPVTPMAAVAGAVAEAVLAAMTAGRSLHRAHTNNGGDIALHLTPKANPFRLAIAVDPTAPRSPGVLEVPHSAGVATSGAHGRSHSRGIADSVTVLATTAPAADVAATLIANATDLPGHPAISRTPARRLSPDSDLGDRLVTTAVGPLTPAETATALDAGEAAALQMLSEGLILGAILVLGGRVRLAGAAALAPPLKEKTPCPTS